MQYISFFSSHIIRYLAIIFFYFLFLNGIIAQCDCPSGLTNTMTFSTVDMTNSTDFIVPPGVTSISIQAIGGDGGDQTGGESFYGGSGACFAGTFSVVSNDVLKIIVGERGVSSSRPACGGGGGGTAVINSTTNTLLIVAGGGGGASSNDVGGGGRITDNMNPDAGAGGLSSYGIAMNGAGGGGGFNSNGQNSLNSQGGSQGTLAGGGAGGSGVSPQGGFGFGGGGQGADAPLGLGGGHGGGGGGFIGGAARNSTLMEAEGGDSFRSASGISNGSEVGIDGGASNLNGTVKLCWNASTPAPIPTLGQWGMIALALLFLIIGVVVVKNTSPAY